MFIPLYLQRLGYKGALSPTFELLQSLHSLHVQTFAFENITTFIGEAEPVTFEYIQDKILIGQRGGGCYELNGLFYELLCKLGFDAKLMCAKVYKGKTVDEMSKHACIRVHINNRDYYVDTGFGEGVITTPLPMDSKQFIQTPMGVQYKPKRPSLLIDTSAVAFSHFIPRMLYHQTDATSWFKNNLTCMIATESSQNILLNLTYTKSSKTSKKIESPEELHTILTTDFRLNISPEISSQLFSRLGK
ncbi:MAG: arylamine N-acetyltransferase [Chlamydiales bacterium]|nr:arylamine N-acetyltransferase [Chlamydiales bacterium]